MDDTPKSAPPTGPPTEPPRERRAPGCTVLALGTLAAAACVAGMLWGLAALTAPRDDSANDTPGLTRWRDEPAGDAGSCTLALREAQHVGSTRYVIRGVARVPADAHVWLLAHGEETENTFWPQLPPITPHADGSFRVMIYLGGLNQIGREFEVALVALGPREHARLSEIWARGMQNDWEPISLPPGVCPASVRHVSKPWF